MEAISNFVRSKYLTSATDGCGGGCQFDLTWNGWGFPAESATIYIVSPYRRRHCLHFCSLVYDLRIRSSGRIYEHDETQVGLNCK